MQCNLCRQVTLYRQRDVWGHLTITLINTLSKIYPLAVIIIIIIMTLLYCNCFKLDFVTWLKAFVLIHPQEQ